MYIYIEYMYIYVSRLMVVSHEAKYLIDTSEVQFK